MVMSDVAPLMQLRGVRKTFGTQIIALRGVDLDIRPGRVHGLGMRRVPCGTGRSFHLVQDDVAPMRGFCSAAA